MRTVQISFLIFIFVWAYASAAWAASAGTSSANFLEIGVGPRAVAMGDAQVGLADDVYATFWNPAGLALLEVQEAGFTQNQYIENITQQYVAYAFPHSSLGTFAGSLTYLGVGAFQGYDAAGLPTENISASDASLGFSYGRTWFRNRRMGSGFHIGISGKYIQEKLDETQSQTYASDIGLIYSPGKRWGDLLEGWRAGCVVRNLGPGLRFDQDSFPLTRSVDVGLSYKGRWRDEFITVVLDGRQPNSGHRSMGVGLELNTFQFLFLRTGYTSADELGTGLRMGGGIRFKTVQIDYAYVGEGNFGAAHRMGLTLHFGNLPKDPQYVSQQWYEKGLQDYRHQHFTEAMVKFNKALEVDPSHPDALRMMKQTYEEIKAIVPE